MRETQTDPINARLTTDLRPRSACWKARFRLPDGKWHQFSIGWDELSKAKDEALKHCSTADFKQKDTLPPCARKFRCVMPRALAVDRSPRQDWRSRTDRTVELAGGGRQRPWRVGQHIGVRDTGKVRAPVPVRDAVCRVSA